ncbi:MAG: hypothetical protein EPO39_15595 [Candidatus Manganitrophaceae bacterium]|nr:MAG: hypothetical protein EPO39_15595 [Candidatus Manganitrophaceae bacterium]
MKTNPWRAGVTLALTVTITYTICAVLYALFPEQGITFLNALFHGIDFNKLGPPLSFTFLMFVYPLFVFAVWGFLVGALYAQLNNLFHDGDEWAKSVSQRRAEATR